MRNFLIRCQNYTELFFMTLWYTVVTMARNALAYFKPTPKALPPALPQASYLQTTPILTTDYGRTPPATLQEAIDSQRGECMLEDCAAGCNQLADADYCDEGYTYYCPVTDADEITDRVIRDLPVDVGDDADDAAMFKSLSVENLAKVERPTMEEIDEVFAAIAAKRKPKRGRPVGSKNKPKPTPKRGRPAKRKGKR